MVRSEEGRKSRHNMESDRERGGNNTNSFTEILKKNKNKYFQR